MPRGLRRSPPVIRSAPCASARSSSRVAVAQGFYGGGLIAAMPLYAIVNVDRLDLSLADVGIIGILTAGATTLSFLVWGAVADRCGPLVAMRLGSMLGLGALIAYAFAPDVAVLWVAAVAAGAGSASIDVGIASVVSDHTSLSSRAAAMAGWNAITGARGIVAAFTMSALLQVGMVDVTSGLLLCAAISGIGVVLYARAGTEPVPARTPGLGRHGRRTRAVALADRAGGRRAAERDQPLRLAVRAAPDRYDGGDAPDALGGGAAPHLHRRRARPAPPRGRAGAQRARGDRAHLRRDVRGGPGRRDVRGRSRRPGARPSPPAR